MDEARVTVSDSGNLLYNVRITLPEEEVPALKRVIAGFRYDRTVDCDWPPGHNTVIGWLGNDLTPP